MKLKYVDGHHGYYLGGKRCKGVSTCAKIPDENYALDQWRKRMVALGLSQSEALLTAVRYFEGDKDVLNDLAERAMNEAGAHLAAEAGTAAHTTTELHDRGEKPTDTEMVVPRWESMLGSAGLQIDTSLIERIVVFPEQRVCGRFDRLARRVSDGKLVCIDLKTGASAVKYPHAVAAQLAMYANAPLLAGEMDEVEPGTFVTEDFSVLPADLDRNVGYMLHMPDDGEPQVYAVNLKVGCQVVNEVIFPTLKWRGMKASKIIRPL